MQVFWALGFKWLAHERKQRSLRALKKLDDHLLDDIGLYRQGDDFAEIKAKPIDQGLRYVTAEQAGRRRLRVQKRVRHRQQQRRRKE